MAWKHGLVVAQCCQPFVCSARGTVEFNHLFPILRGKTASTARILSPNPMRQTLPCLLIQSFFYAEKISLQMSVLQKYVLGCWKRTEPYTCRSKLSWHFNFNLLVINMVPFSIMYYAVTKRIAKSALGYIILIIGFRWELFTTINYFLDVTEEWK